MHVLQFLAEKGAVGGDVRASRYAATNAWTTTMNPASTNLCLSKHGSWVDLAQKENQNALLCDLLSLKTQTQAQGEEQLCWSGGSKPGWLTKSLQVYL